MSDNITLPRADALQIRAALRFQIAWNGPLTHKGYTAGRALAALDAALAEPEHIHTCGPDCQKPLCVNRRREIAAAVEAEREACAEICDAEASIEGIAQRCATKIRARGSK